MCACVGGGACLGLFSLYLGPSDWGKWADGFILSADFGTSAASRENDERCSACRTLGFWAVCVCVCLCVCEPMPVCVYHRFKL